MYTSQVAKISENAAVVTVVVLWKEVSLLCAAFILFASV